MILKNITGMPSMDLLKRICFTLLFLSLVGCGGGDGSLEGGDGVTPAPDEPSITINLAISDTSVTGQEPVMVTATVADDGSAVANQVVSFSTSLGLGAFSPSIGTALTNSSGVAEIVLTAGKVRGADTLTASLISGEEATIGFATQGDDIGVVGDINVTVSLVDSDGNPTTTITASKPGKIIATIDGITSPEIVSFSSSVGEIPITTAITDENNQAFVDIYAGGALGAGQIAANLPTGESGFALLVVGSSTVEMGSGTPFEEGVADISLEQISAGGTSVISVSIIDDQGALFTEPVEIYFSSSCTSSGTATLSSPVTTSNGLATSTYLAKGCVDDDPINVTANAGGINLSASTSVNVLPADVGSIEFISATPENIFILGTGSQGGSESSIVQFRVLDTNSNAVNNQVVNFSLNTNVGGITFTPESATSNNEGIVQTVINSGTVATSVRVKADIEGSEPLISSQSSRLVVSTGIPDQDSFSLSANVLNPEGWDLDGTEVEVTARLADAFNNPAPDGTIVSFTTEGGSIEPSCSTVNGLCTVTWSSQYPRPEGHVLGDINNPGHLPEVFNTMGQKYGGRATIIATAIGEESFPDLNGNARFDANEVTAFLGNNISGVPYDLKEAFVDHNEDAFYNPDTTENAAAPIDPNDSDSGALEEFADFNSDNLFTQNDSKYNGVLCAIPAHDGCAEQKSLNVRGQLVLVMSTSSGQAALNATNDGVSTTYDDDDDPDTPEIDNPDYNPNDNVLNIAGENSGSVVFTVADLHNQPMPAGTIITGTTTAGSVVVGGTTVWPSDNHNGGMQIFVGIKGAKEPVSGSLFLEAESPNGLVTALGSVAVVIQ